MLNLNPVHDQIEFGAAGPRHCLRGGRNLLPRGHLTCWRSRLTIMAQTPATTIERRSVMQLRWLGTDSKDGDSPTLWDTDSGEYVVQGYTVTDPQVLAQLNVPEGEAVIRVPKGLMTYLPKDQHGAADR